MSVPMRPEDPAYWMLKDGFTTKPVVCDDSCYICRDPEFAQMGLPLCSRCPSCMRSGRGSGHIPADDVVCSDCGYEHGADDYTEDGAITCGQRIGVMSTTDMLRSVPVLCGKALGHEGVHAGSAELEE